MGPMVYGAAYWPAAEHDAMCALGFDDSKALSAASRAQLFDKMRSTEGLGYVWSLVQCEASGCKERCDDGDRALLAGGSCA